MRNFLSQNKVWIALIIAAGIFIAGFFVGRSEERTITDVKYLPGKTIKDTVPQYVLVPASSSKPDKPKLPTRPDTVYLPGDTVPRYITSVVDTPAIISDYITENNYNTTLFDNATEGKMIVKSTVQYNKLAKLGYDFTPIYKQTTIERKKIITPFVTGSYNTMNIAGAGGGVYYHNLGFGYKYLSDLKSKTGHEFGIYIKF